jgi:hypothetical protein
MDAFSWVYPNIDVLNSTLNSFPFEVLWIGNKTEIELILNESNVLDSRIRTKVFYNDSTELENALKLIPELVFKPGIILFTSTDSDTEHNIQLFNNYLSLVQLK